MILLAGKGHEPYQEIAGVRRPFSDIAEAKARTGCASGGEIMSVMMDLLAAAIAMSGRLVGDNASFSGVSTDSPQDQRRRTLFLLCAAKISMATNSWPPAKALGAAAAVVAADAVDALEECGLPLAGGCRHAPWRSVRWLPTGEPASICR